MFNGLNHIKSFNILRRRAEVISESSLRDGLKECNLPINSLFILELRRSNLLVKIDRETYSWSKPLSPVHFKTLNNVYSGYRDKVQAYYRVRKAKEVRESKEIVDAIALLKDSGYLILKKSKDLYKEVQY